jgi:hypothetical protein
MAARPGREPWNKIDPEEHKRRGTYRADRHGPQAGVAAWLPASEAAAPLAAWQPTETDVATLGDAGRTFLERTLEEATVDFFQGQLLMAAAHTLDRLTVWRAQAQADPKAARLEIQYTRVLSVLLSQLGLR